MSSRRARAFLLVAIAPVLAGCSLVFPITDPLAGATVDARDVLLTGDDVGLLDGATEQDETEPFASTVDDYLAARATDVPPIDPEQCGDAVVDLVLLDRDAGAAGTVYAAPRVLLANGDELAQTAREFPTEDAAQSWFADYRAVLEGCPQFTVHLEKDDLRVSQTVEDARYDVEGFTVRLRISGPSDVTYNEQWMLRDGPFVVLVSGANDDGSDDALLPAVELVRDRLVAAVDASEQGVGP